MTLLRGTLELYKNQIMEYLLSDILTRMEKIFVDVMYQILEGPFAIFPPALFIVKRIFNLVESVIVAPTATTK